MIPKRLREAREAAGLSQEALSEMAIISRSSISSYESGRHVPDFELVVRVANTLNYPAAFFYTEDDEFASLILALHQNRSVAGRSVESTIAERLEIVTAELQQAKKTIEEINKLSSLYLKSKS